MAGLVLPMVALLSKKLRFPPVWQANREGLIAVGGDLSPARLILAYESGIFPWPVYQDLLTWFAPDPRTIIELDGLHVSRSLKKTIRKGRFEVRLNTAFEEVVALCAEATAERPSTWITQDIYDAYNVLHEMGVAHSVETWQDNTLVGGLYGVSRNGLFAGESMFSRATDASKVALVALVERMKARGMTLLDVQVDNPHLQRLGSTEIPRWVYQRRLKKALRSDSTFVDANTRSI